MKTTLALFLGALLSVVGVAATADSAADPIVGTWKLDAAKSKFSPGPAQKSSTRTYAASADGTMTVTVKSVGADGKESTLTRSFKVDGKDYPIKDAPDADSITEKRISSHTTEYVEKKAGKVTVTARRVVSKDNNTLTVTETGTDATGTKFENKSVYSRQ
jgi:hypothetical protein